MKCNNKGCTNIAKTNYAGVDVCIECYKRMARNCFATREKKEDKHIQNKLGDY